MQHRHGKSTGLITAPRFCLLLVLTVLLTAPAVASVNWEFLGQRVVNDRAELDTIHVGAQAGRFTGLRLSAGAAPVELKRLRVHFGNGEIQTIERNRLIAEGGSSPTLDLIGGRRVIKKVVFHYEARSPGRERAVVQLYGRH